MQYDNPNNKEMCQLLNATKLPYILMYKGSKGKVDEFQCGPGNFQVLIDKIVTYADSEEDIAAALQIVEQADIPPDSLQPTQADRYVQESMDRELIGQQLANADVSVPPSSLLEQVQSEDQDVESLRQQLATVNNEKVELFEIMKTDLDWHKDQIQQLRETLQTQRDQYETLLRARDKELSTAEQSLIDQQTQFNADVLNLKEKLAESLSAAEQHQQSIQSLQAEVNIWQQRAKAAMHSNDEARLLEQKITVYENERNSLRKLSVLAVKRVWRGAGVLFSRFLRR